MKKDYHPVVKAFIEERTTFLEILTRLENYDEISNLMYRMRVSLQTSEAHELLIKEAFDFNYLKLDTNLQFLFLNLLDLVMNKVSNYSKNNNFIPQILQRISGDTHPVLAASYMLFKDFSKNWGNSIQKCMLEIEKNYNTSPRYFFFLHNFMILVSQIGQLEPYLSFYKKFDPDNKNFEKYILLVSLQETDPLADNFGLYNQIKNIPEIKSSVFHQTMTVKYMVRDLLKKEKKVSDEEMQAKDLLSLKDLINANIALLNRNPSEALAYTRNAQEQELPDIFLSKTAIRVELSNGNLKTAKLLAITASQNKFDLMEDFYFAQINLLEGNLAAAEAYMSKLNVTVEKYKAQNLLELEFKLAPHLTMNQVRFLIKAETLPYQNTLIVNPMAPKIPNKNILKIIGNSEPIENLRKLIKQYADLDNAVLIQGETGTGKELIAQSLHEQSKRAKKPFLAINCASILGTVLQSEFFGHESGAFTGAQKSHQGIFEAGADGTVFLDEIGEISPEIQVALLRVLEAREIRPVGSAKSKPIHCRIITATNANLPELVKKGVFRSDLYYRLQRLEIHTPPLRERGNDIILLATHFLNSFFPLVTGIVKLNEPLQAALLQYDWPGNIRELKNEMEKMRLKNADKEIYELSDAAFLLKQTASLVANQQATPNAREKVEATSIESRNNDHQFLNHKSQFRRIELLKKKFTEHGRISREEAAKILNVSSKTIGDDFKLLLSEGFIEKKEPTKSPRTHYFILRSL